MSAEKYDEDAPVLDSASNAATESESDNETLVHSPAARDKDVLDEHDEAERLLVENQDDRYKDRRKERKRKRIRGRKRSKPQDGFVYKMEEGVRDSSSSSTDSLIRQQIQSQSLTSRKSTCVRWAFMLLSLVALFLVLVYGAVRASSMRRTTAAAREHNNGTHVFKATTILISLDGFRADFLQRGLTPSLNAFVASGISPQYMLPSFPSVTFPNHYTLVTGLYPESHGIVGNQFWDPKFEEEFYYTNTSSSMQAKWWESAEPLWVTAEKQGVKTAVHMWPGSEAHIHGIDPSYLDKFKSHEKLPKKTRRILEWLDKDYEERPQLIAAYVPDVDRDGHKYGPNSTEIRATIADADNMLTLLVEGLLERNLTEIVNIVVVSDHGMATMSAHRMVQLDDLIDMSLIDHIDGWPLRGLRLKDPLRDLSTMHGQLTKAAAEHGTFDVYTKDTMPDRYHFSNNDRIAPLWIVPRTGWLVIEKIEFDIAAAIATGTHFDPIGVHGFDHEHPLMRAIFIARGPAFPHAPNSRAAVFQNIELYNIVCDSLGVEPHPNNGTVRLPMKTIGLHSDFDDKISEPADNPADTLDIPTHTLHSPAATVTGASTAAPVPSVKPETVAESKSNWWKFLHEQLQQVKDWAKELIASIKNNHTGQDATAVS